MTCRLIVKASLALVIVLGLLGLTWYSLWKWNETTSAMLILGNVTVLREVLTLMAHEVADEDNGNGGSGE